MQLFRSESFSSYVEGYMEKSHVPGLAIALVENGTVDSKGYGMANLDPPKPCTPDTLFDIASASKSLTAAAVGMMIADNEKYPLVQYETPMSTLLPDDFAMPGKSHDGVTVEDVLSHRTGMPRHDSSYLGPGSSCEDNARSITRNLRNLQPAAPIRSVFLYCNMMYTVASYLVERMSGVSFADYLEQKIFDPLGMNATNLQQGRARAKGLGDRIATGYFWDNSSSAYQVTPLLDYPEAQGAGYIITSANDYLKWVMAMMNQQGPINPAVYEGLTTPRVWENSPAAAALEGEPFKPNKDPIYYAIGWEVRQYQGHTVISHDGSDDGWASCHFFVPDLQFGGVILGNANSAGGFAREALWKLVDSIDPQPVDGRPVLLKPGHGHGSDSDSGSDSDEGDEDDGDDDDGSATPGEPEIPLSSYIGDYSNPGYHTIKVQQKDGELFIDGNDRSLGFTVTFTRCAKPSKYCASLRQAFTSSGDPIKSEFTVENGRITKLGLQLESALKDLIWFWKLDENRDDDECHA